MRNDYQSLPHALTPGLDPMKLQATVLGQHAFELVVHTLDELKGWNIKE